MTTKIKNRCAHCSRWCWVVDRSGYSRTVRCWSCRRCSLIIEHPAFSTSIALSHFHAVRGNGKRQIPLRECLEAMELLRSLQLNCFLKQDLVYDFGVETNEHRNALVAAVQAGVTSYDLDRVMRDGPAITQLVRCVSGQPHPDVTFTTVYDGTNWWEEWYSF